MFKIEIKGIEELKKRLDDFAKKQVPFAAAKAINKTGQKVKVGLVEEMKRVFKNPTPYTLNSLQLKPATKQSLVATVWFKEFGDKGTAATKYLPPQVFGGSRDMKRSEKKLGSYYVPGGAIRLNKYGNITPGVITGIMSNLKAFTSSGYSMNRATGNSPYFAIRNKGKHLIPGVWKRNKTGVKPMLIFTNNPNYSKRLSYFEVAQKIVDTNIQKEFDQAFEDAMRTAK